MSDTFDHEGEALDRALDGEWREYPDYDDFEEAYDWNEENDKPIEPPKQD